MSTRLCVEFVLALPLLTVNLSASPITPCDGSTTVRCSSPGKRTIEVPAGVVDGKNNAFTLTEEPRDASELRLFNNGSEMMQGSQFQVNGREIRIADNFTPAQGSFIQASYVVPISGARKREVEGLPGNIHALTRSILLQSLAVASPPPPHILSEALPVPPHTRAVIASSHKIGESLTLLTQRIDERRVEAHRRRAKEKNSARLSLSGFEGVNDISLSSPYASLFDPQGPSALERSLSPTRHVDASSQQKLRSLSMLEQRLDTETATDVRTEGR